MRVDLNSKSALRAGLLAASVASALLPAIASAQVVWPSVPTTRTRTFNNLSGVTINDRCVNLEDVPDECIDLQDGVATIPVLEKSSPYPSEIEIPAGAFVSGAKITDVNVTLRGVGHHFLDDVDILLVGPQGQYVMLMSNVSGLNDGVDTTESKPSWKFDDSASMPLPNLDNNEGRFSDNPTTRVGGVSQPNPLYNVIIPEWVGVWTDPNVRSFKPSDYDSRLDSDVLPEPAPQNTTTTPVVVSYDQAANKATVTGGGQLSVFNGTSPAGKWQLYVGDDFFFYDGALDGWEIEITAK